MTWLRHPFRSITIPVYVVILTSLLLLTGCAKPTEMPTTTPVPSATLRPIASITPRPTQTQLPSMTPTLLPTATETPPPAWVTIMLTPETGDTSGTPDPNEQGEGTVDATSSRTRFPTSTPPPPSAILTIQKPGPYSKVVSPIELRVIVHPGDDKLVYLDLIGEDGRVINSQNYNFSASTNYWIYTVQKIPFEIQSFAESARLVLYTRDQYNRIIYQVSVDLILLQFGDDSINIPVVVDEPYIIRKPWEGGTVRGGVMEVDGLARLVNDQPLIIELIDEEGNLVGSAEVEIAQPSALQPYVPFIAEVPYSVSQWTRVRFVARQESATRIPGTVWLTSVLIYLEP